VVEVIYHVGSKNELPGHTGFAHMFEHVMFTGSGHVPYGLHDKFTGGVGGFNNGETDFDFTRYYESNPSNYLETALWLEADRMGFLLDSLDETKFKAQRDIVKNERGLFLILENGTVQRHETGQRDPAIVLFNSYGFDLSWLSNNKQSLKYSVRERYLWELFDPTRTDQMFVDAPDQVRAEFHDRITAPLYPLAFVVMTYAYLGAPRTTRQGRTMSLMGAISVVAALRGLGFVGMIAGVQTPIVLVLPYIALIVSFVLGYLAISRGVIIEPPAFIANAITAIMERIAQRASALMGQPS